MKQIILTLILALCAISVWAQNYSANHQKNNDPQSSDPESLDYEYYMNQPFTPDTAWHFSNEPYKKMTEGGKAQLKIHISNISKELASEIPDATARVTNQITLQEENYVVSIGKDNCYVFDLNLPYPQFVFIDPFDYVFIAPGDSLEMFSTIESVHDGSGSRFKTFRGNSESAMINTLLPIFVEKYGRQEYNYKETTAIVEKGKDATQALIERWANQVNEIMGDEELRQALINSPLSTYGKDLVMISALTSKCIDIENVVRKYVLEAYIYTEREDGIWNAEPKPNYVTLDLKAVYNILLKNKELIYNNPLVLSESKQWVFINRTLFGPLLYQWEAVADEQGNIIDEYRRDDYGMAGTFVNDIFISQDIVNDMNSDLKDINLGLRGENREENLEYLANEIGKSLAGIQNIKVAQAIVGEYRKFVKATETAIADNGNNWTEEQNALWNKIVSPYKGYTLILDFWGMGCGPCRSGMMSQKNLVEEMKNENIKFLYIATEKEKDNAEKWMSEKNIKGEHIYISDNEWKQFETMINFTAIPRGALVSKNGKLIENNFNVEHFNGEQLKKLAEKF